MSKSSSIPSGDLVLTPLYIHLFLHPRLLNFFFECVLFLLVNSFENRGHTLLFLFHYFFFPFSLCLAACGILVLPPGIEPMPPALWMVRLHAQFLFLLPYITTCPQPPYFSLGIYIVKISIIYDVIYLEIYLGRV